MMFIAFQNGKTIKKKITKELSINYHFSNLRRKHCTKIVPSYTDFIMMYTDGSFKVLLT